MDIDLSVLIQDHKSFLTEPVVKSLTQQLLEGLKYIHSKGIIHRDIKTSNLLLTREGTLKIGDFGLAREYKESRPMSPSVVTVWYRAPEILLGDTQYDFSIDVWSAGCILGELLCGSPIFRGKKESQLDVIVSQCGMIDESVWPGVSELPEYEEFRKRFEGFAPLPQNVLREKYVGYPQGARNLLVDLLELNPTKRPSAKKALENEWFVSLEPKPQKVNIDLLMSKTSKIGKSPNDGVSLTGSGGHGSSNGGNGESLGKKRLNSFDRNTDPKRPHTSSYGGNEYSSSSSSTLSTSSSSSSSSSSSIGMTRESSSSRKSKSGSGSALKSVHHYVTGSSSNSGSSGSSTSPSHRPSGSSSYHSHHRK